MDKAEAAAARASDPTRVESLFTKAGWARFVQEVAALEDAAADGNTWGPEADAAILARLVIAGLRKGAIK